VQTFLDEVHGHLGHKALNVVLQYDARMSDGRVGLIIQKAIVPRQFEVRPELADGPVLAGLDLLLLAEKKGSTKRCAIGQLRVDGP